MPLSIPRTDAVSMVLERLQRLNNHHHNNDHPRSQQQEGHYHHHHQQQQQQRRESSTMPSLLIPEDILEETRSALRVLQLKYPLGVLSLGGSGSGGGGIGSKTKKDHPRKRACALLVYTARPYVDGGGGGGGGSRSSSSSSGRQHQGTQKISMDQLAKVAGMKPKEFQEFHETIGNFWNNIRSSNGGGQGGSGSHGGNGGIGEATATSMKAGRYQKSNNNNNAASASIAPSSNNNNKTSSTIPSLSIQLGAFVPNTNKVATQAETLLQNLVQYATHYMKPRDRTYCLQDIQRHRTTYEAACFYFVATSAASSSTQHHQQQRRQRRRRRFSLDGGNNDNDMDDDIDDLQLDVSTLLDVTKHVFTKTHFEMVLEYVTELQAEMQKQQPQQQIQDEDGGNPPDDSLLSGRRGGGEDSGVGSIRDKTHCPKKRKATSSSSSSLRDTSRKGTHTILSDSITGNADSVEDNLLRMIQNREESSSFESIHKNTVVHGDGDGDDDDNDDNDVDDGTVGNVESTAASSRSRSYYNYSPIFLEWKQRVLVAATAATANSETTTARSIMNDDDETTTTTTTTNKADFQTDGMAVNITVQETPRTLCLDAAAAATHNELLDQAALQALHMLNENWGQKMLEHFLLD